MPYQSTQATETTGSGLNASARPERPEQPVKKLVLCFDGTGNAFSGSTADTNIVKLFEKFDRDAPNQFHYYQTGIGTYDIHGRSVNKGFFSRVKSRLSCLIDQGIGTSFDVHVMAGYKFLMNHYDAGDKIYMFGFSRGAFTARFLARMVNTVGLLSKGNDEMIPFAYELYQSYVRGGADRLDSDEDDQNGDQCEKKAAARPANAAPTANMPPQMTEITHQVRAFSRTFCRRESKKNIKVYFLGLFDCVNSVAVLEKTPPYPVPVLGNATHVRHAVAVDEFRVKFKVSLLAQDVRASANSEDEDIKEVWFPGNHGDVGGGWPADPEHVSEDRPKPGRRGRFHGYMRTHRSDGATKDVRQDPFQMSDVPLDWMIRELELVGLRNPDYAISLNDRAREFQQDIRQQEAGKGVHQALNARMHNTLNIGGGTAFGKVIFWKVLVTRYELVREGWVNKRFPLNGGSARDIPEDAVLHHSLVSRLTNNSGSYRPRNNHGSGTEPCLVTKDGVASLTPLPEQYGVPKDDLHTIYRFHKLRE